ncbi:hypothetical protein HYV70_02335 [Candidatus Uhrbacteria bacterium]|nr:hypothetical protein [Candidatus Uhrbacteria bacterium]
MLSILSESYSILAFAVVAFFWFSYKLIDLCESYQQTPGKLIFATIVSVISTIICFIAGWIEADDIGRSIPYFSTLAVLLASSFSLYFIKSILGKVLDGWLWGWKIFSTLGSKFFSRFKKFDRRQLVSEDRMAQADRILELVPSLDRIDLRSKVGEIVAHFLPTLHEQKQRLQQKIERVKTLGNADVVRESLKALEQQMVLNGKNIQSCHDFLNAAEAKLLAASEDGQGLEGLSDLFTGLLSQIQVKCSALEQTNRQLQEIDAPVTGFQRNQTVGQIS